MAVKIRLRENGSEERILSIESSLQTPDLQETVDLSMKSELMIRTSEPSALQSRRRSWLKKWLDCTAHSRQTLLLKIFKEAGIEK